ncbi:MAG: VanZ family protein [Chlorogloeopsis fritschii C42_A2020_084]|uniref:VanZ family protein n=1 Tax=Chlorogloeopsis fritschii TaxID=1124 RepID=UPI0019F99E78|nr:VanZ family protein [Chlorogloeopsis fritschii]MBF2008603.1 VanZ family protein [Chlorogloeopsis fritschii C42_A2020_084]
MKRNQNSQIKNSSVFLRDWTLFAISILVILVATLYPFDFTFPENFSIKYLTYSFHNHSSLKDKVENVLLFMPLGFLCTSLLQKKRTKLLVEILIVIFLSALLSTTVEILQAFLPIRTSTPDDVINNTIGGFAGWLFFNWFISRRFANRLVRLENSASNQIFKKVPVFLIGYILLNILTISFWQSTTYLSNWNPTYPLLIGNELTENRAWKGYVSEVIIADRAIDTTDVNQALTDRNYFHDIKDSLVAYYQLDNTSDYKDQSGNTPKLVWRGQPSETKEGKGVFISSNNWLKSATPVYQLNKRISKTSEFTISTTIATTDLNQTGPARIISISDDPVRRNFTLGQEGTTLNIRVRTPASGTNGSDIQMNIPDVFVDNKLHHILITYSQANLQVYIDNLENSYSLNFLQFMPIQYKLFYYFLTFIPLGIYLTLLTLLVKKRQIIHRWLIVFGILLPSLMLEASLVSDNGKDVSLRNILLGILFMAVTVLILRIRAAVLVKKLA